MASTNDVAAALQAYLNVLATDPGELANFLSDKAAAVNRWYSANQDQYRLNADAVAEAEGILLSGNFKLAQAVFSKSGDGAAPLSLWVTSWVTGGTT